MNHNRSIPIIPGHFLLGSLSEFKQDALGFMKKAFLEQGGVVEFYLGRTPLYLISDPELVSQVMIKNKDVFVKVYDMDHRRGLALVMGNGLVNSKGALWQRQRRMMQPMFQRGEMAYQGEQMIRNLLEYGSVTIDMMTAMSDVTLKIIARTMFSNDSDNLHQLFKTNVEFLLGYAQRNFFHPIHARTTLDSNSKKCPVQCINASNNPCYRRYDSKAARQ
jgi:cytochrome P450